MISEVLLEMFSALGGLLSVLYCLISPKKSGLSKTLIVLNLMCFSIILLWHLDYVSYYSLSGVVPTCAMTGMVFCLCALILPAKMDRFLYWLTGLFMFLIFFALNVEDLVVHNSFMMKYYFAVIFFISRPITAGLALFSTVSYLGYGFGDLTLRSKMKRYGYNGLMGAAIVFLLGEISGCYWSLLGWGTTWRWSGGFFCSAALFLLIMLGLHIPRKLFDSQKKYGLVAAIIMLIIAMVIVVGKLY